MPKKPRRPRVTRAQAERILPLVAQVIPEARCELDFRNPFELLIATQLSAQSTDAMVNKVTPTLFARWPTPEALAVADPDAVEAVLRPTGFFRQKTRNAIRTAQLLVERHGGQVPPRMEDLVELPGTARKTANVVLLTAFGVPSGLPVDTHVFRVTRRWGWHAEKTPERVEPILLKVVPKDVWTDFGHRSVLFGRHHCTARAPRCEACPVRPECAAGRGEIDI
jgi:endonuclease-3